MVRFFHIWTFVDHKMLQLNRNVSVFQDSDEAVTPTPRASGNDQQALYSHDDFYSNEIVMYTPEERSRWRQALATDPVRFHELVRRNIESAQLPEEEPAKVLFSMSCLGNRADSFSQNLYAAISMLTEQAKLGGEVWDRLVSDGIIDTLCIGLLNPPTLGVVLAHLPLDLQKQVADQVRTSIYDLLRLTRRRSPQLPSSYYPFLRVLSHATLCTDQRGTSYTHTPTSIKCHWTQILQRVCSSAREHPNN